MLTSNASRRPFIWIILFGFLGLPSCIFRFAIGEMGPLSSAFIFGIGIIAGAFLISWAAEAAQLYISASFAIAILALITILPEYAIEVVLAWLVFSDTTSRLLFGYIFLFLTGGLLIFHRRHLWNLVRPNG